MTEPSKTSLDVNDVAQFPLGRSATDVSGFDLLYGVRVRF